MSDKQKKGPRWGHGRIVNRGPAPSVMSPAQKEPPVSTEPKTDPASTQEKVNATAPAASEKVAATT
ncbi:MAG: hypothetical protein ABW137_15850 [Mycobacterium sp.]